MVEGYLEKFHTKDTPKLLAKLMKFNDLETIHFFYTGSYNGCEMQMATDGAKRVLELVKNTKIDVIIQDVFVSQCFYSLLEVNEI